MPTAVTLGPLSTALSRLTIVPQFGCSRLCTLLAARREALGALDATHRLTVLNHFALRGEKPSPEEVHVLRSLPLFLRADVDQAEYVRIEPGKRYISLALDNGVGELAIVPKIGYLL